MTWKSPVNRAFNQINHIAINRQWKKLLLDVGSYRRKCSKQPLFDDCATKTKNKHKEDKPNRRLKFNLEHLRNGDTRNKFEDTI